MIELTRKTWAIFGYKGGGKSTLAQYIASVYAEKCLYYDTLHEVSSLTSFCSYKPQNRQDIAELLSVIATLHRNHRFKMFIIDEANRYCPPKPHLLPSEIADLNDWARHSQYSLSVGYIARRPVQLNTDLTELCDYLFVFHLGGKNDIKYLNDLRAGLGDAVRELPPFHFALVNPSRTWEIMSPITPSSLKKLVSP